MISPEGYAKLTTLLCTILLNQEELAHMIHMAASPEAFQGPLFTAKARINEACRKALEPISESDPDKLFKIMPESDREPGPKIDNAEEKKLVMFFRSEEGDELGREGDYDNLSPADTAIRAMRKLLTSGVNLPVSRKRK